MNIGYIGAGNLACALAKGAYESGFTEKHSFYAYDIMPFGLERISRFGVKPLKGAGELIEKCSVVILAVKPKDFPALLKNNSHLFKSGDTFIVSVAAGTETGFIIDCLGYDAKLARIMPNINAAVGGAATGVYANDRVGEDEKKFLMDFCSSFGKAFEISEEQFGIFGVIGGCSPAFTYMYIDALARAAVKTGMPKKLALDIASAAVKGSAKTVEESDDHPWELIDRVCSPGGTTIEGVCTLQERAFESAVENAVFAAYDKDCKMRGKK